MVSQLLQTLDSEPNQNRDGCCTQQERPGGIRGLIARFFGGDEESDESCCGNEATVGLNSPGQRPQDRDD